MEFTVEQLYRPTYSITTIKKKVFEQSKNGYWKRKSLALSVSFAGKTDSDSMIRQMYTECAKSATVSRGSM